MQRSTLQRGEDSFDWLQLIKKMGEGPSRRRKCGCAIHHGFLFREPSLGGELSKAN